jgi:hypothetical protein
MQTPWMIPSRESTPAAAEAGDGVYRYFAIACALTWLLAVPAALSWSRHEVPPPYAVACAGLSAFGPLLAALAVAGPRRQLREVFGRWRTQPGWILLALLLPIAVRTLAVALFAASGGRPVQWFWPPAGREQAAALVVFPWERSSAPRGAGARRRLFGRALAMRGEDQARA